MAGQVTLSATGFTSLTITNSGATYQLLRGYGPQGEDFDISWARSPFTHPVPTNAQVREGNFSLPVRVIGASDAGYDTAETALLDLATQPVWNLQFVRGSWSRTYLCSASTWNYVSDAGAGFRDINLPQFKQSLLITVPCVRVA